VELTGLPKRPAMDAVTGVVIGSDNPVAGTFKCSDARVNQLQSNIQWGERGNYLSVPTDCPQRDERLGWMADAQVFMQTGTFNNDVAAFFTKWLTDVDDAQFVDGRFTNVSPDCSGDAGVPGWGDAGVICPWILYQAYGDTRILERHFDAMSRWVDWSKAHSTNFIRDKDRGPDFGDWLAINADTPKDLVGTAYFAYSTHLVALSARRLGKTAEANKYDQLFNQIKQAFDQRYLSPDGHLTGNTQTDYLLALKFDLLPDKMRVPAAKYLEDDIHGFSGRQLSAARADANGQSRRCISLAVSGHVSIVAFPGDAGGDNDLGTMGRLDAMEGFPNAGHEFIQSLFAGLMRPVAFRKLRRHRGRSRGTGIQAHYYSSTSGSWNDVGGDVVQFHPRPNYHTMEIGKAFIDA